MAALDTLTLLVFASGTVERVLEIGIEPLVDLAISPDPIEGDTEEDKRREKRRKRARRVAFSLAGVGLGNLLAWAFGFGVFHSLGATETKIAMDFVFTGILFAGGSQVLHPFLTQYTGGPSLPGNGK